MIEDLTILCITRAENCILHLITEMQYLAQELEARMLIACDGLEAENSIEDLAWNWEYGVETIRVQSESYLESVHDEVVSKVQSRYVFRLDDDESVSSSLLEWLKECRYRDQPHWKFPRAHLWGNDQTVIVNPPLYPDHQTRLSVKEMAVGRSSIHCGSPFGGGELCPHPIIHHKFLVKSIHERQAIRQRYNKIHPGAGENFLPFSVPEDYYSGKYDLRSLKEVEGELKNGV